jgi:hypothetical protein
MKHKALLSSIAIGILFMSSIFLQNATARADSGNQQLRTWLHDNQVIPRLVKLDRQDGFTYGLSLRGGSIPGIVIAPGWNRTWLLQIEGEEAILQADARGHMQIIAQTDNLALYLCYLKKITEFLLNLPTCTIPLCYVDKVLALVIALQTCAAAAAS